MALLIEGRLKKEKKKGKKEGTDVEHNCTTNDRSFNPGTLKARYWTLTMILSRDEMKGAPVGC